jgi:hypothetical protein
MTKTKKDKNQIESNNEIIAIFMGQYQAGQEKQWDYDWSWSCLMEVIDKIETIEELDRNKSVDNNERMCNPYRIDIINRNMVEILRFGEDQIAFIDNQYLTKKEAIYLAVVKFIEWYNEKSK